MIIKEYNLICNLFVAYEQRIQCNTRMHKQNTIIAENLNIAGKRLGWCMQDSIIYKLITLPHFVSKLTFIS